MVLQTIFRKKLVQFWINQPRVYEIEVYSKNMQ